MTGTNLMRKPLVYWIIICLLATTLPIASAEETDDIPAVANGTGDHDSLVAALNHVDLVTTLQGTGPFTVFAPTDQAFSDAGIDLNNYQTEEEKDALKDVLLFHVFNGSVPSSAVTDGMMAEMINGDKVSFTNDGTNVTVGGATVIQSDVAASNGIIHVVDKVLTPPTNIPTTASGTGIHSTLVSAVVDANLLSTLEGDGPFTVFAPTDQAFTDLGVDLSTLNTSELSDILLYHVVQSEVPASAVTDCMSADAANMQPLSFTVGESGVMVNDANVITTDVISSNGLIHVIDKVLMPTDTPRDIPRTAQCTGEHDSLVAALIQAELVTTLQGNGPFTVFAPTDQAFAEAGINLSSYDTPEGKTTLTGILLHHVVISESISAAQIEDGQVISMANGDNLTLSKVDGKIMIGASTVTNSYISVSNGIIHVVNKVIMPPSDEVSDTTEETDGASDDDSQDLIWIGLGALLIISGLIGVVLFIRSKGAAATLAKDFSTDGLINQLQTVEVTAYTNQPTQQMTTQATFEPQTVQTVEVVEHPVAAEPTVLRQWTDEAGYTWRAMDDGKTYWWTGSDWQIYG